MNGRRDNVSRELIRRLLLSAIALSLSLCPFMHSAAAALPVRAGIFVVRLESDKAVYQLGEPIRLRVTIRNNTPKRYAVMWMQVWGLCGLTILNSEGQSLSSTGNRGGFVSGGADVVVFSPGETIVAGFPDPQRRNALSEWANLKYWGYDLNRPGEYTITALPTLGAWEVRNNQGSGAPEFITSAASDKSNAVHIAVVK